MKLTEHLYKTSGVEWGTNSNTFALDAGEELIMLDLGFGEVQWKVVESVLRHWNLGEKYVSHTFLTHGHYDHAGNVFRANALGSRVIAADPDASKIENGYPEMEELFGLPFVTGRVDERPSDGQTWCFGEEGGARCSVTACAAPGHSEGSFAYVIEADGHRALVTGDMFYVKPHPPMDAVDLELAFMGGWDFSLPAFEKTLRHMAETHCDILLPGHYYTWFGDVDRLCLRAADLCAAGKYTTEKGEGGT